MKSSILLKTVRNWKFDYFCVSPFFSDLCVCFFAHFLIFHQIRKHNVCFRILTSISEMLSCVSADLSDCDTDRTHDDLQLETTIRLFLCPIAPEKKLVKTNATNMFQEANGIESSEPSSASVNCSPISVPTANGDVLLECSPIFLRELTDFNGNGNLLKS